MWVRVEQRVTKSFKVLGNNLSTKNALNVFKPFRESVATCSMGQDRNQDAYENPQFRPAMASSGGCSVNCFFLLIFYFLILLQIFCSINDFHLLILQSKKFPRRKLLFTHFLTSCSTNNCRHKVKRSFLSTLREKMQMVRTFCILHFNSKLKFNCNKVCIKLV